MRKTVAVIIFVLILLPSITISYASWERIVEREEHSKKETFVVEPNSVVSKDVFVKTKYDRINFSVLVFGDKDDKILLQTKGAG